MIKTTSPAAQDYLKAIFLIGAEADRPTASPDASTSSVAQRLGVSAASATNMLKRLDSAGLVTHAPYRGVELTQAGRNIALEVIRHHRLLETYLADALGVPWDEVHAEAEILEHVLSEDLEERIAARLGNPTADPHGHPIPSRDLRMPAASERRLWEATDGESIEVERVSDDQPEVLRYLGGLGIRPGAQLEVSSRGPAGGPLFVRVDQSDDARALSREMAEAVWVG